MSCLQVGWGYFSPVLTSSFELAVALIRLHHQPNQGRLIQLKGDFSCLPWVDSHSDIPLIWSGERWWERAGSRTTLTCLQAILKFSLGCSLPRYSEKFLYHSPSVTLPFNFKAVIRAVLCQAESSCKNAFSLEIFPLLGPSFPDRHMLEVHLEKSRGIQFHIMKEGMFPVYRKGKRGRVCCCCCTNEYIE